MARRRNGLGFSPDVHAAHAEELIEKARTAIRYADDPRSCRQTFVGLRTAYKYLTAARVHALAAPAGSRKRLLDEVSDLRIDKEDNLFKKRCLKD